MSVAGVLLAAGAGTRFAGSTHKLLALWQGRPIVVHALDALLAARSVGEPGEQLPDEVIADEVPIDEVPIDEVIVVDGAVDLHAFISTGVRLVHNPNWANGQASSLHLAVVAAGQAGHDAVVVGLGDQPRITAQAWRRVAAAGGLIAVANYGGQRRNPVRLHASVWPALAAEGDEGARTLMAAHPEWVIDVACPGHPLDVDTLEDLRRLGG